MESVELRVSNGIGGADGTPPVLVEHSGQPAAQGAATQLAELLMPQVLSVTAQPQEEQQVLTLQYPVAAAWHDVLSKFFGPGSADRPRMVYDLELEELEQKLEVPKGTLLEVALEELGASESDILYDEKGGLTNSAAIGEAFDAVYQLAREKLEVSIASDVTSLYSPQFALNPEMAAVAEPVVRGGQALIVVVAKEPPRRAAEELRSIAEQHFGGLMSLWQNRDLWDRVGASPALKSYLEYATVRIMTTGHDAEHAALARTMNSEIEKRGGFEDSHWTSLVKGVTQGDRHHALKEALAVCFPVVLGVKALESYAPGLMHSVGGMLDDLFGAIIPDVSQSMGKKGAPFKERFKEAWPVLREGLTSLPIAVGLGWGAAALYGATQSVAMHALSGALFALACSAGTVGTSIGAYRKASATIEKLRQDPVVGEHVESLGTMGRLRLALQESIFDVPFRVGHTVVGVPVQIALGVAAGVGGFFHNGLFVMAEGMLETLLGAGAAFGYPAAKSLANRWSLRSLKPGSGES